MIGRSACYPNNELMSGLLHSRRLRSRDRDNLRLPPEARWGLLAPWQQNIRRKTGRGRVQWAAQELTTGRLLPWFAVAYGTGVVLYFTAEREPAM